MPWILFIQVEYGLVILGWVLVQLKHSEYFARVNICLLCQTKITLLILVLVGSVKVFFSVLRHTFLILFCPLVHMNEVCYPCKEVVSIEN